MKKNNLLVIIFMCINSITHAQNWSRIYYNDKCFIDYPTNKMEIPNEYTKNTYNALQDILVSKIDINLNNQLIIQQKGLNDKYKNLTLEELKFAKVVIMVSEIENPDKQTLFENINLSEDYKNLIDMNYKNSIHQMLNQILNMKMIWWHYAKLEKVGAYNAVHIKYERQLLDQPIVIVNTYVFFGKYEYVLTLSHRVEDTYYWQADFEKILKSFTIM